MPIPWLLIFETTGSVDGGGDVNHGPGEPKSTSLLLELVIICFPVTPEDG